MTVFLIFILISFNICASENEDWIQENIDLTINTHFDQAIEKLDHRLQDHPDDYRICFYKSATLSSKMTHFENTDDEKEFYKSSNRTIKLVQQKLGHADSLSEKEKAELYFFLGSSYGYQAFFEGRHSRWHKSITNGMKSIDYLNMAIKHDAQLYEAYLGIGTYKYWLYSRLKYVSWLPFVPDERKQGIEYILKAIENKSRAQYMAMHQLIYVLLDYNRGESAIPYAEKIVEEYPQSQFMWWAAAHVYFKLRHYDKAISYYQKLLELIQQDENKNPVHLMRCQMKLALLHYEQDQFEIAQNYCKYILNMSENKRLWVRGGEIFEEARMMNDKCDAKLGKS